MSVVAYEGVVEQGHIRLKSSIILPENTIVYVVVPSVQIKPISQIVTRNLAHPEQIVDFKMEVIEETTDANL